MGFPLRSTCGGEHERRVENLVSSQKARDRLLAYYLAPAIIDLISDGNWECCNNIFEILMLLHSEWSKEIKPSRQSSKHHALIVSNSFMRKVRSSCAEACGEKRPRCQRLYMTLASFGSKKRGEKNVEKHESEKRIPAHRASSKSSRLFLTKLQEQLQLMIRKELVCFSILYIKLFKLVVEVAFNNPSAVTHRKVDLLKFPLWSSSSEPTNDTFVLLIRFCFFRLYRPLVPVCRLIKF